jgi:hypothetical protein
MTRRTLSWSVAHAAAVALLATACSSSTGGTAAPSAAGGASSAPTVAPTEAAPSSAQSAEPSGAPSIAIPSFVLPNDDKGLEALLPDQLCGKKATKLSMSGERFANVPDESFSGALSALGKSPKDVAFAMSTPDIAGNSNCQELAIVFQIKGADSGRFRDVFIAAAKAQDNTTYTTGNVGGKDVYIGTTPGDTTKSYAYFKGDALFMVQAADDASAATLLKVMP